MGARTSRYDGFSAPDAPALVEDLRAAIHSNDAALVAAAARVLMEAATTAACNHALFAAGGQPLLLAALSQHHNDADVVCYAARAIGRLAKESADSFLMEFACFALAQLIRSEEASEIARSAGAIDALLGVLRTTAIDKPDTIDDALVPLGMVTAWQKRDGLNEWLVEGAPLLLGIARQLGNSNSSAASRLLHATLNHLADDDASGAIARAGYSYSPGLRNRCLFILAHSTSVCQDDQDDPDELPVVGVHNGFLSEFKAITALRPPHSMAPFISARDFALLVEELNEWLKGQRTPHWLRLLKAATLVPLFANAVMAIITVIVIAGHRAWPRAWHHAWHHVWRRAEDAQRDKYDGAMDVCWFCIIVAAKWAGRMVSKSLVADFRVYLNATINPRLSSLGVSLEVYYYAIPWWCNPSWVEAEPLQLYCSATSAAARSPEVTSSFSQSLLVVPQHDAPPIGGLNNIADDAAPVVLNEGGRRRAVAVRPS